MPCCLWHTHRVGRAQRPCRSVLLGSRLPRAVLRPCTPMNACRHTGRSQQVARAALPVKAPARCRLLATALAHPLHLTPHLFSELLEVVPSDAGTAEAWVTPASSDCPHARCERSWRRPMRLPACWASSRAGPHLWLERQDSSISAGHSRAAASNEQPRHDRLISVPEQAQR